MKKSIKQLFAVGVFLASFGAAYAQNTTVKCSSENRQYGECRVNYRVRDVKLLRQRSDVPCTYGVSFGLTRDRYGMWIDRGCRGYFELEPLRAGNPPGRPGFRDVFVRCYANGSKPTACPVGHFIRDVWVHSQMPGSNCITGYNYGVTGDGKSIFAGKGCRAVFRVTIYD